MDTGTIKDAQMAIAAYTKIASLFAMRTLLETELSNLSSKLGANKVQNVGMGYLDPHMDALAEPGMLVGPGLTAAGGGLQAWRGAPSAWLSVSIDCLLLLNHVIPTSLPSVRSN